MHWCNWPLTNFTSNTKRKWQDIRMDRSGKPRTPIFYPDYPNILPFFSFSNLGSLQVFLKLFQQVFKTLHRRLNRRARRHIDASRFE